MTQLTRNEAALREEICSVGHSLYQRNYTRRLVRQHQRPAR